MLTHERKNRNQSGFIGCCVFLLLFFVTACDSFDVVIEDLSQADANTALVLLRDKNIEARKEGHAVRKSITYQIKVKKSQSDAALRLLVYNRIPSVDRASLKEVYPPGSSGLIPTKSDELARLMMAMQGEIEGLLKVIPGIADARVVISFDQPAEYNKATPPKKASVALIYRPRGDSNESPMSDWEVKTLIATTISGLLPEDVTVVQKMIKPEGYVDNNQPPQQVFASPIEAAAEKKDSSLLLFGLTALALVIAAYSAIRLYLQKQIPKAST